MTRLWFSAAFLLGWVAALPAQQSATSVMIVTGSTGEARHAQIFDAAAAAIYDVVTARYGVPASRVAYLSEQPSRDAQRMTGRADKESVRMTLAELAAKTAAGDQLLVVLIGHGSAEGGAPRFNIPGPDLTALELADMLAPLGSRRIAVVNAASASGPFVSALSAAGRIVITATRSAAEKNETLFATHFAQALDPAVGDSDKDGAVSLREAFEYASREVARAYEQQKRLATEHALIDDNGDGRGSVAITDTGDGMLAGAFLFRAPATAVADPALRNLYEQKQELERRIAALRQRKSGMPADAYEAALEKLLLELAARSQDIREAEGR